MESSGEIGVCEFCSHTGLKESFYSNSKRFCTAACSHSFSAKHRFGKVPASSKNNATDSKTASKTKAQKKFILPSESERHQCISMGFDWGSYLVSKKSVAASVEFFQHSPMAAHWGDVGDGMKIEVLNLDCSLNTKVFWIASVIQTAGYKAKLRYEGFGDDSSCDFWCNLCTQDVNAVGWCATIGKPLVPPQTIQHKYSNWKNFLVKKLTGAKTLPNDFQKRIVESVKSPFLCNMRLEVVDKTKISRMRVGIVNEVIGGRLQLKYEDSDYENDDFWCHCQSALIHPLGWCEKVGHRILVSSKDYKTKKGSKNVRQELFVPVKNVKSSGFEAEMKLEAIDPLNLSAICVATVKRVLKNGYLMIGIDGSEAADGSDWFCYHCTSPSIFPVGFCMQHKISLSVPKKYRENFSWETYLKDTESEPAPVKLFECEIPDHGFKSGMKLEAVDLMEPRLICVATVTKVVGRLLHVHFDGWESQYDQWVDCQSPDIYPVGWCELVGYELQPPPNMLPPATDQQNSSAKKKKVKGQSFVTKKKRKRSSVGPKKAVVTTDQGHSKEKSNTDENQLESMQVSSAYDDSKPISSTADAETHEKVEENSLDEHKPNDMMSPESSSQQENSSKASSSALDTVDVKKLGDETNPSISQESEEISCSSEVPETQQESSEDVANCEKETPLGGESVQQSSEPTKISIEAEKIEENPGGDRGEKKQSKQDNSNDPQQSDKMDVSEQTVTDVEQNESTQILSTTEQNATKSDSLNPEGMMDVEETPSQTISEFDQSGS